MKKTYIYLGLIILLILVGGYFKFSQRQGQINEPRKEPQAKVYKNETLGEAAYSVNYFDDWEISENSTGKFGLAKDQVIFVATGGLKIRVEVVNASEEKNILNSYNIESQSQTEVSRLLGTRIIGSSKDNPAERQELVLIKNGSYLYVFSSSSPDAPDFQTFLSNVAIINNLNVAVVPKESFPVYKLYFPKKGADGLTCQTSYYREVYLSVPTEELELIPMVIKALLSPEQLQLNNLNLTTNIPVNTRLLSFGYNNNKVIVNFSSELNQGGGSCEMSMRRSQIEKTLKALSEVSNLKIKEVEIWVEGEKDTALQP